MIIFINAYLLLSIALSFYFVQPKSDIFQTDLARTDKRELLLTGHFGFPPQSIRIKFITSSSMFWISNKNNYGHGYNPFGSKTSHHITSPYRLVYKNQEISCALIEEDFTLIGSVLEEITAPKMLVYLAEEGDIDKNFDGVLGLAPRYKEAKWPSFIDNLKANKQIDQSILMIHNEKMYLGSSVYSLLTIKKIKFFPFIVSRDKIVNGVFSCKINLIYSIKENNEVEYVTTDKETEVNFKLGANVNIVPKKYFKFMTSRVMNQFIETNQCFTQVEGGLNFISCKKEFVNSLGKEINVHFTMGKRTIKFEGQKLFINSDDSRYSLFIFLNNKNDDFAFGLPLLDSYGIIFDNEVNQIGLFNENI